MPALTRRSALSASAAVLLGAGMTTACTDQSVPVRRVPDQSDAPITRLRTGATFHGFWNYASESEMLIALRSLRNAGGRWVRIDMGWAAIETARGVHSDWALQKYDVAIDLAHSEDLNVMLVFQRTPSWASGTDDQTRAPIDASAFGDFALDMCVRYAGRVFAVEVWNEPNHSAFFTAQASGQEAREHAKMVADAYSKIREHGPQGDDAVLVLAGGTSTIDIEWWRRMYALGIAESTDIVAVNPYPVPADISLTDDSNGLAPIREIDELITLMSREGDADKPIWFTEFGWSIHWNWFGTRGWEHGVSDGKQADRFEETVKFVESEYPQIEMVLWYNLRDRDGDWGEHEAGFGLMKRNLAPKPVMRRMEELFVGG